MGGKRLTLSDLKVLGFLPEWVAITKAADGLVKAVSAFLV